MVAITRKFGEFDDAVRHALQQAVGQSLSNEQEVTIQVTDALPPSSSAQQPSSGLPDWCRVYEGLTGEEVAALEAVILQRADLSRLFE